MWPFSPRYDTKSRITNAQIRTDYAAYEPLQWWPLDAEYLLWSKSDAERFARRYGIPFNLSYHRDSRDCDNFAIIQVAEWYRGVAREGLPACPAFGILWLKCLGSMGTHMMNDWRLKEGLYRYEPQTSEFRTMESVERVFGRMG